MRHERLSLSRDRWLSVIEVAAIALLAVALIPAGALVFEATSTASPSPFDPTRVEQLAYRDFLLSSVTAAALVLTAVHAYALRTSMGAFVRSLTALGCLLGAQVLAAIFTYPVLEPGQDWSAVPAGLEVARRQWEYAQAASCALNLAALLAMVLSVQASRPYLSTRILDAIGEDIRARAARARALAGHAHDR